MARRGAAAAAASASASASERFTPPGVTKRSPPTRPAGCSERAPSAAALDRFDRFDRADTATMGISKGAKKPKASAAEAPPWPAPPPQADTEDQQGLFSMLHTLAQQLEAQKARADTAAARCSALSKEMEEREGRWKKRPPSPTF